MTTNRQYQHSPSNGQPVPDDTIVIATLEDGHVLSPMRADELDWDCPGDDVIHYEIVEGNQ